MIRKANSFVNFYPIFTLETSNSLFSLHLKTNNYNAFRIHGNLIPMKIAAVIDSLPVMQNIRKDTFFF